MFKTIAKKVEKKVPEVVSEPEKKVQEVVPPLNVPQPSELTTDKLLKQVQTSSPPAKGKKKKPEQNVLSLIGKCFFLNIFSFFLTRVLAGDSADIQNHFFYIYIFSFWIFVN